jgi:hypothetical protein
VHHYITQVEEAVIIGMTILAVTEAVAQVISMAEMAAVFPEPMDLVAAQEVLKMLMAV